MTNTELEMMATRIEAFGLVSLFQRIADTYVDGLRIARASVASLINAGLVTYSRGVARVNGRGMSVSTRLIVRSVQRTMAQPSHWRT